MSGPQHAVACSVAQCLCDCAAALPLNTAVRMCVINYPLSSPLHLTSLSAYWGLVESAVTASLIGDCG